MNIGPWLTTDWAPNSNYSRYQNLRLLSLKVDLRRHKNKGQMFQIVDDIIMTGLLVSYNKALENGTVGNTVQMSIVLPFVAICFPIKNNHPFFSCVSSNTLWDCYHVTVLLWVWHWHATPQSLPWQFLGRLFFIEKYFARPKKFKKEKMADIISVIVLNRGLEAIGKYKTNFVSLKAYYSNLKTTANEMK